SRMCISDPCWRLCPLGGESARDRRCRGEIVVHMPTVLKRRPGRRFVASLAGVAALSGAGVALAAPTASALPPECSRLYIAYNDAAYNAGRDFGSYTTDVIEGNWDAAADEYAEYQSYAGEAADLRAAI